MDNNAILFFWAVSIATIGAPLWTIAISMDPINNRLKDLNWNLSRIYGELEQIKKHLEELKNN